MSDVTDLLDAVAQVRTGSGLNRARASLRAMQTIMRMSPDDKRAVALLVADRVAPHLVERIEAGTGQDLSKAQVETVVQLLQKLDADDLQELRSTVTDAESRGVALREISLAAASSAAVATGLEELTEADVVEVPTGRPAADHLPPPVVGPTNPDPEDEPQAGVAVDAATPGPLQAPGSEDESAAPGPDVEATDDDAEEEVAAAKAAADAELAALEAEAEELKAEARRAQLDAEAEIARLASEHAAPQDAGSDDADGLPATAPTARRAPDDNLFDELPQFDLAARAAARVPHDEGRTAAADRAASDRTDHNDADRIRAATGSAGSLAAFRTALDGGRDPDDVAGLLALVRLVPDGWGRRHAVDELLRRDLLHGEDAATALACLTRAGDRRFVAGTILARGAATPAQLRDVVDGRTLDRLARRASG